MDGIKSVATRSLLVHAVFCLTLCGNGLVAEQAAKPQVPVDKRIPKKHGASPKSQAAPPKVAPPASNQIPAKNHQAEAEQFKENVEIQGKLVTLTQRLFWVGVAQGIVLIVQAIAFFLTLRAINRQADIMQRQTEATETASMAALANAQAARAQIEAIIAENRPWLLLDKIEVPYLIPAVENPGNPRFAHCFTMTKNHGKTPAKVMALWVRSVIGESAVNPPKDLAVEICNTSPIPEPYIFPPGEIKAAEATLSTGVISPQDQDDVLKNKVKFLWVLGFVKYRNTFEKEPHADYETRFCHVYETRLNSPEPFWTPAGPPEFNRAT